VFDSRDVSSISSVHSVEEDLCSTQPPFQWLWGEFSDGQYNMNTQFFKIKIGER